MIKNKTVLAVILLLALIPLTASATLTRVIGMGGEGAGYIIKDASNPGIWPQLVKNYPNLAGAEFYSAANGWDFQKAYINYNMGDDKCVLQFSLDKIPGRKYTMAPDALDDLEGTYNRLNVIWGRKMGELKVGLALNYTGKSMETEETAAGADDAYKASYSTYGLRAGVTALEEKLDLALGFEIASFSEDVGGTTVWENDGSMSLAFAGRYWYKANDHYALIPNLKFSMMKDAGKADNETAARTVTEVALGCGNNWKPVDNMLAIWEVGVLSQNDKVEGTAGDVSDEFKNTQFNIYWRLGFESKIFDWLNGRFGAERTWRSMTKEWTTDPSGDWVEASGKPKYGVPVTNTYLGATAHWNRLWLDFLVAPQFMANGPYFISGEETNIFSKVSLFYKFSE